MQRTGINDFYNVWQGQRIYVCPFCVVDLKLLSFIMENTISFSAVDWGIKDPVDKLTCDKF